MAVDKDDNDEMDEVGVTDMGVEETVVFDQQFLPLEVLCCVPPFMLAWLQALINMFIQTL